MKWVGTSWKMNHNLEATKKYINAITTGAIILPSNSPSLIHLAFKGLSNSCFNKASKIKTIDIDNAQILIVLPPSNGQIAIKRKTIENKIPKLFSEDLFISYFL